MGTTCCLVQSVLPNPRSCLLNRGTRVWRCRGKIFSFKNPVNSENFETIKTAETKTFDEHILFQFCNVYWFINKYLFWFLFMKLGKSIEFELCLTLNTLHESNMANALKSASVNSMTAMKILHSKELFSTIIRMRSHVKNQRRLLTEIRQCMHLYKKVGLNLKVKLETIA